jgi:hypothetical protein
MNLALHCQAMIDEYEHRFGKSHKCTSVLQTLVEMADPDDNPVVAYRKFYASKPRLRYPVDKIPEWVYDHRTEPFEVVNG